MTRLALIVRIARFVGIAVTGDALLLIENVLMIAGVPCFLVAIRAGNCDVRALQVESRLAMPRQRESGRLKAIRDVT